MIITPMPFMGVSAAPAVLNFTDDSISGGDVSSYTFTTQAIGTASSDRRVIVGVAFRGNLNTRVISSVTVDGQSCSQAVHTTSTANPSKCAIYITDSPVPSGTTASIVVTLDGGATSCGIGVWSVTGLTSVVPTATNESVATNPATLNVNVLAGGIVIGMAASQSGSTTMTWTGATERFDATVDTTNPLRHSGAGESFLVAQTPLSLSCNFALPSAQRAVSASFR